MKHINFLNYLSNEVDIYIINKKKFEKSSLKTRMGGGRSPSPSQADFKSGMHSDSRPEQDRPPTSQETLPIRLNPKFVQKAILFME